MVERDEQSPSVNDDSSSAGPAQGDSGRASGGSGTGALPGAPVPDDYSALLAALGHHLDHHPPDEIMVLLRAEMERRELQAYASGWRDAAAHYERALAEARVANGRSLRLVERASGQAVVIPLRHDEREAAARKATDDATTGDGDGDSSGGTGDRAVSGDRRPTATPPALVPKSPGSPRSRACVRHAATPPTATTRPTATAPPTATTRERRASREERPHVAVRHGSSGRAVRPSGNRPTDVLRPKRCRNVRSQRIMEGPGVTGEVVLGVEFAVSAGATLAAGRGCPAALARTRRALDAGLARRP